MLTSAMVLEKAVDDLKYLGGTFGAKIDPTPFLCLVLKLLQIQPQREIIYLYIEQSDFKYLRALGAFYLRLVGTSVEVYKKLEPIYNDYRKLRLMDTQRKFSVIHMDEFIDSLLHDDKVLNISLPRLTKRIVLEENRDIEPYKSELEEQNLIPTQLIEEKVERQRDEERKKRQSHPSCSLSRRKYDHDNDRDSSRSRNCARDFDDRTAHHSYRRPSSHHHDEHQSSRQKTEQQRSRSKSPQSSRMRSNPSGRAISKSSRFSQARIDSENAIRAKLGLGPLK